MTSFQVSLPLMCNGYGDNDFDKLCLAEFVLILFLFSFPRFGNLFSCVPFVQLFNQTFSLFFYGLKKPTQQLITTWKISKYGVFSGPYFSAFGLNTERYVNVLIKMYTRQLICWKETPFKLFLFCRYIYILDIMF